MVEAEQAANGATIITIKAAESIITKAAKDKAGVIAATIAAATQRITAAGPSAAGAAVVTGQAELTLQVQQAEDFLQGTVKTVSADTTPAAVPAVSRPGSAILHKHKEREVTTKCL
ncbi:MAG: hypothetical protein ACI38A_10560 [Candidatus Ornithomonoglobus sp.]